MNSVTLSFEEATRILHLMRNVQMNLSAAEQATHPVERNANPLFSTEFAGELNTLVNALEGSIFESDFEAIGARNLRDSEGNSTDESEFLARQSLFTAEGLKLEITCFDPALCALSPAQFAAHVIAEQIYSAKVTINSSHNEPTAKNEHEEQEMFTIKILQALAWLYAFDGLLPENVKTVREVIQAVMDWMDKSAEFHDRPTGLHMSVAELLVEEDEDDFEGFLN